MPLDTAGKITYKTTSQTGNTQYQADPPVCSICHHEITRINIGQSYVESDRRTLTHFECMQCRACTPIREGGPALRHFIARHHL